MTDEVEGYQAPTAKAARDILRASKRATASLARDILAMLGSSNPTREELMVVLDMPPTADAVGYLVRHAETLPEPLRTQWLVRLSNPATAGLVTLRRAVDLRQRMAAEEIARTASATLSPLIQTTVHEASLRAAYDVTKQVGMAVSFSHVPKRQIEQVMKGTAFGRAIRLQNEATRKYALHLGKDEARAVKTCVLEGMLAGQGVERIARNAAELTGKDLPRVRTLVRTTLNAAANDAKRARYEEIGIDRVRFLSTLDERTCKVCGPYDGRTFPLDEAPRLPLHPNCRCLLVSAIAKPKQRRARDAEHRDLLVPGSMTYEEWRAEYGSGVKGIDGLPTLKDA